MNTQPTDATVARAQYKRALWVAWAVQVPVVGSMYLLVLLPRMLNQQGIDLGVRGCIMAAFTACYFAGALTCGRGVHRLGYRTTVLIGCLSGFAGCLFYCAGSHWIAAYFVGRALHGFGCGWVILGSQGWLLDVSQVTGRGHAMGKANLFGFAMIAVSPVASEAISRLDTSNGVFLLAAFLCLLLVPVAFIFPTGASSRESAEPPPADRMLPFEWAVALFMVATGFAMNYSGGLAPLITASRHGWGFSLLFATYGITGFITRGFLEKRVAATVPVRFRAGAGCLLGAATMLLVVPSTSAGYAAVGVVFGLGHALFFPGLVQLATHRAGAGNVLSRFGKLSGAMILGNMAGDASAGLAARQLGLTHACLCGGGVILAAQAGALGAIYLGLQNSRHLLVEDADSASPQLAASVN